MDDLISNAAFRSRQRHFGVRAFTLIELLVVISILVILMGMLMPILNIAKRASMVTATRAVFAKVDTAIRLFRAEYGPYPWQESYADLASGATWTNRLYGAVGTDLSAAESIKIRADAETAASSFEYPDPANPISFFNRDTNNYAPGDWHAGTSSGYTIQLNQMAAERTRLAIFSGNVGITCPIYPSELVQWNDVWQMSRLMRIVKPTTPLLATPTAVKPGMAKDYLKGELEPRYISGDVILDAWKRPLLYVCQVVEGMTSQPMMSGDGVLNLKALDWGMAPLGRKTLADKDAITGQALTADASFLPDVTTLRHSDRRYYAPRGLETEFELWSAGPDGRADWMRDAAVNYDNISLQPYDKTIP